MTFCQACGAKNAEDARFCNLCGARIVKGEAGASPPASVAPPPQPAASPSSDSATRDIRSGNKPTPQKAPADAGGNVWAMQSGTSSVPGSSAAGTNSSSASNNPNFSNQTLSGVGIPSQRRTYAMLAAVALAFLGIGALLMYFAMHDGDPSASSVPETDPEHGATVAEATVPVGVDDPDDGAFLEGTRVVRGGGSTGGGTSGGGTSGGGGSTGTPTGGSTEAATGGTGTSGAGATAGATTAEGTGGSTPHPGTASGSTGGGSTGGGSTAGGSTGGGSTGGGSTGAGSTGSTGGGSTGSTGAGSTGSGSTGGTTGTDTRDWEAMRDTVSDEPVDHELNLYVTNVRRFIRNNYARQAGSCFSHATAAGGTSVTGRVVIGFTISGTGSTDEVHVARNETGVDTLGTCLVNRVDSWALPAPPGREPVTLEMPFTP